jgi:hypothetical protein
MASSHTLDLDIALTTPTPWPSPGCCYRPRWRSGWASSRPIAAIPRHAWTPIVYPDGGIAQVAETRYRGGRLVVRRTRLVGEQAELFPNWRYHAFVTDRVGTTVELDADHRRHAVVELAIRDLKAGVGLRHFPSGKFNANAAWLLAATLAHNLLRWVAAIGLGAGGKLVVAKTLRRTLLSLPGHAQPAARALPIAANRLPRHPDHAEGTPTTLFKPASTDQEFGRRRIQA